MPAPQIKTIEGVEVQCVPLEEYPRGFELGLDLAYVGMPALTELGKHLMGKVDVTKLARGATAAQVAALAAVALGDDGAGKLFGALESALRRLRREDPEMLQRLVNQLLCGCVATVPKDGGGVTRIDLNTPAKIQQAIAASGAGYPFFVKLIGFALGANFGGPFAGVFGGSSKEADPPASTTPTP